MEALTAEEMRQMANETINETTKNTTKSVCKNQDQKLELGFNLKLKDLDQKYNLIQKILIFLQTQIFILSAKIYQERDNKKKWYEFR